MVINGGHRVRKLQLDSNCYSESTAIAAIEDLKGGERLFINNFLQFK